jgi:L-ascorbate metabolism protein UlaG (beta-lactamase superfamily)
MKIRVNGAVAVAVLSSVVGLGAIGCGPEPPAPPAPPAQTPAATDVIATGAGPLEIVTVEHATFVMLWNGTTIAVDPVGGVEAFADFPKADLILITDIHGDHLSIDTVAALNGDSTMIVAPAAVIEKFPPAEGSSVAGIDPGRITALANGETVEWKQGFLPDDGESFNVDFGTVEAVPMYNLSDERRQYHVKGRGNGYILTLGGARIYISGDTEDIPEMRALENIDAAFVCMNLPYTMDAAAAADAVLEFRPKIVFPYHFRGTEGRSDLDEFRRLVAADPDIEVRVLDWY